MSQSFDHINLIMHLRNRGIQDTNVLGALERVPREMFVLPAFREQAYKDIALPIDCGQTISQPFVVARMTELLQVEPTHKVLEIGTGSGYQSAVLSHLAEEVFTIERFESLKKTAHIRLQKLGLVTVRPHHGDGRDGLLEKAPFDRIIVTAAAPEVPSALTEQLADGGILVMPLGDTRTTQQLIRITRNGNKFTTENEMNVKFVPLRHGLSAEQPGGQVVEK